MHEFISILIRKNTYFTVFLINSDFIVFDINSLKQMFLISQFLIVRKMNEFTELFINACLASSNFAHAESGLNLHMQIICLASNTPSKSTTL